MNGYTSININGQNVGIKFGYLAIKEFSLVADKKKEVYYDKVKDETGKETESLSFLGIAKLIHCGYKNNCEVKEVDPVFTLSDFNDWVEGAVNDEQRQKELAELLIVFSQSQYVKALAEMPKPNGQETEEAKKKIAKSGSRKLKPESMP